MNANHFCTKIAQELEESESTYFLTNRIQIEVLRFTRSSITSVGMSAKTSTGVIFYFILHNLPFIYVFHGRATFNLTLKMVTASHVTTGSSTTVDVAGCLWRTTWITKALRFTASRKMLHCPQWSPSNHFPSYIVWSSITRGPGQAKHKLEFLQFGSTGGLKDFHQWKNEW